LIVLRAGDERVRQGDAIMKQTTASRIHTLTGAAMAKIGTQVHDHA
jgi:hypothetical protein